MSSGTVAAASVGIKRPRIEPKMIANKIKRGEVVAKLKAIQKREKRKKRDDRKLLEQQLGAAAPPKQVPRTIDNTRELDETVVLPGDEEVLGDEADDEFAAYFAGEKEPKVMITTRTSPSGKIFRVLAELMAVIPNSFYYRRGAAVPACSSRKAICCGSGPLCISLARYRRQVPTQKDLRVGCQAGLYTPHHRE